MKYKIFSNASTDKNRDRLQFVYFNSINLIVSLLYKGKLKGLLDSARQFYYGSPSQLRAQSFTPLNTQNKINYQFCPSNRVPLPPIKICLIETNKNSVSKHRSSSTFHPSIFQETSVQESISPSSIS